MGFSQAFGCMLCGTRKRHLTEGTSSVYEVEPKSAKKIRCGIEGSQNSSFETDSCRTKLERESECDLGRKIIYDAIPEQRNRALAVASKGRYDIVEESFPVHNEDEIIIATRAVGLNPIDWKSVDYNFCLPDFPWITGREMAGVVERVGSNVKDFKAGDCVWTSTYYKDRRAGCFQHFVTVPQHTVSHIPENLGFESAACLGVAGLTSAMTLWKWLQVPFSADDVSVEATGKDDFLLIWGGSTVTAQFAIQLAVRSGLQVITVTSSKTRHIAERLGATHVISRDGKSNEELVDDIRMICGDNITRAIDLVGTETAEHCIQALSKTKSCLFAPLAMISNKTVVPENISVEVVEMKKFVLEPDSKMYAAELNRLVLEGHVTLPTIEVIQGGLDVIQSGLMRVKAGNMAGKKMVVSFT